MMLQRTKPGICVPYRPGGHEALMVAGRWRRNAVEASREGDTQRRAECVKHARFALNVARFETAGRLP